MEETNTNQTSGAPPRLIVKKPGAIPASPNRPPIPPQMIKSGILPGKIQTARIDLQPVEPAAAALDKKKTSRISLDAAALPPGGQTLSQIPANNPPQTIRLKRPPQASSHRVSQPIEILLNQEPITDLSAAKKQTSRISLESALMPDETATKTATDELSTIRVKRPSSGSIVPDNSAMTPTIEASAIDSSPTIQKSQTSRIEPLPEIGQPSGEGQATQRKTIKIRRPGAAGGVETAAQTVPKIRIGGHPAHAGSPDEVTAIDVASEIHPASFEKPISKLAIVWNILFSVTGVAAIVTLGIVIYVLAQQAFPHSG